MSRYGFSVIKDVFDMLDQIQSELIAVTSQDGYIARYSGENIGNWTSAEEQARFRSCFADTDWAIMGRVTHEQVFKQERRRIVFSRSSRQPEWREANHLWLDPASVTLAELQALAEHRHPFRHNLILGGTAVHDWFWERGGIHRIQLAIEPHRFEQGVPLFSGQGGLDPLAYLLERDFRLLSSEQLNAKGTIWHILEKS